MGKWFNPPKKTTAACKNGDLIIWSFFKNPTKLPETNSSHLPGSHPKRKQSSSNHPFSGVNSLLVSGSRVNLGKRHNSPTQMFRPIGVCKISPFFAHLLPGISHQFTFNTGDKIHDGSMGQFGIFKPLHEWLYFYFVVRYPCGQIYQSHGSYGKWRYTNVSMEWKIMK